LLLNIFITFTLLTCLSRLAGQLLMNQLAVSQVADWSLVNAWTREL